MLRGINFEADNAEKVFFKLDSIMDVAQYVRIRIAGSPQ